MLVRARMQRGGLRRWRPLPLCRRVSWTRPTTLHAKALLAALQWMAAGNRRQLGGIQAHDTVDPRRRTSCRRRVGGRSRRRGMRHSPAPQGAPTMQQTASPRQSRRSVSRGRRQRARHRARQRRPSPCDARMRLTGAVAQAHRSARELAAVPAPPTTSTILGNLGRSLGWKRMRAAVRRRLGRRRLRGGGQGRMWTCWRRGCG